MPACAGSAGAAMRTAAENTEASKRGSTMVSSMQRAVENHRESSCRPSGTARGWATLTQGSVSLHPGLFSTAPSGSIPAPPWAILDGSLREHYDSTLGYSRRLPPGAFRLRALGYSRRLPPGALRLQPGLFSTAPSGSIPAPPWAILDDSLREHSGSALGYSRRLPTGALRLQSGLFSTASSGRIRLTAGLWRKLACLEFSFTSVGNDTHRHSRECRTPANASPAANDDLAAIEPVARRLGLPHSVAAFIASGDERRTSAARPRRPPARLERCCGGA
jgi:hypothetical protein